MSNPKVPGQTRLGLFIGACGGSVAAANPEVRFEGRISEMSAERSVRRPLTLMNSAQRGVTGKARRTRNENAGTQPASGIEGNCDLREGERRSVFGEGTTPQDLGVPIAIRRISLTMERLLWLSVFNAVIDIRCFGSTNRATQHEVAFYSQSI
jgi:hypothetical protein